MQRQIFARLYSVLSAGNPISSFTDAGRTVLTNPSQIDMSSGGLRQEMADHSALQSTCRTQLRSSLKDRFAPCDILKFNLRTQLDQSS